MGFVDKMAKLLAFFKFCLRQAKSDWQRYKSQNTRAQIIVQLAMGVLSMLVYYFMFFRE